jgi:hypothetical protein
VNKFAVPDINALHDARQRLHVEKPACANGNAANVRSSFLALQNLGSHYVAGLKAVSDESNTRRFARIELGPNLLCLTASTIP